VLFPSPRRLRRSTFCCSVGKWTGSAPWRKDVSVFTKLVTDSWSISVQQTICLTLVSREVGFPALLQVSNTGCFHFLSLSSVHSFHCFPIPVFILFFSPYVSLYTFCLPSPFPVTSTCAYCLFNDTVSNCNWISSIDGMSSQQWIVTDVPCSDLGPKTSYSVSFRGFPPSLHPNSGILPHYVTFVFFYIVYNSLINPTMIAKGLRHLDEIRKPHFRSQLRQETCINAIKYSSFLIWRILISVHPITVGLGSVR
jgi:hypothetical protein